MCYFHFRFFIKVFGVFCEFEFCGGASVLTMSPQNKIRKLQRKSAFILCPLWWIMTTICKMAALMFRCWMKTILQF